MRYMNRKAAMAEEDDDPLSGVANLFDVAMVFAIGMLLMVLIFFSMPELLTDEDVTIIKITEDNVEIVKKTGDEIEKLEMSEQTQEIEVGNEVARIYEQDGKWYVEYL
ncbi:MAG: hypothetical protein SYNGOMJ08_00492 [Candidatus Syntrophoarchaeum sp. GoM_oil]|nr:MAG: hypothetical protein SYNGOMJ08_00492 [Candidatus Syntrophoarchaeum sp. GoM_oil]